MKVRTRLERVRPTVACPPEESRVDSSAKKESDINVIVARYKKTGVLGDEARKAMAQYGDFSQIPSFVEMQEKILHARELFAALPATVRRQFGNDPGEFIEAAKTPEGIELLKKLGLGKEEAPPPSQPDPRREEVELPKGMKPSEWKGSSPIKGSPPKDDDAARPKGDDK